MGRRTRVAGAAVAGVAVAAAIAACGSSGLSSVGATTASGDSSPIALSKCMRAHGMTNFPDPSQGTGGVGFEGISRSSNASSTIIVDGKTFSGPAVATAEKACARYLGPKGPRAPLTTAQKHRMLAAARCMRSHGVPNFPDPRFSGGAPNGAGAQVNPNTPAFQRAAQTCLGSNRIRVGGSGG
jgi:hypothetical protein